VFPLQDPAPVKRRRVADQIVEDLRARILDGTLPNGSKLPAERVLAAHYDVSAPTVREAIRVLTAVGLIRMRNGARATVTAQGDSLLALSISSVVQFEKMGAREVLGLLGVLNAYAAEFAVRQATDEELAEFREAARRTLDPGDARASSTALKEYFATLAEISHHPLLAALCNCITGIHVGLAAEMAGPEHEGWGRVAASVAEMRFEIADALAERDGVRAVSLVRDYHRRVVDQIQSLPRAKEIAAADPGLRRTLASWLNENVRLAGAEVSRQPS
jgi:GntR family transcriptional repressor for pyruvate dehydrogenase complex